MSKQAPPIVMLDTSFLDCLLNKDRPQHSVATKYFEFWIKNKVVICTSTICIAEFAANAEQLHPIFSSIIELPFNHESAMLAGDLYRKYKKVVMSTQESDSAPGRRDALKDDFKIVAAAANAQVKDIAHNDCDTMDKFIVLAKIEFEQCHNLNAILLKDGFDERKARQILGLSTEYTQDSLFDSLPGNELPVPTT